MLHFAEGSTTAELDRTRLESLLERAVAAWNRPRRVLLVPPDFTRFHSGAGEICTWLFTRLSRDGAHVELLPALGSHTPMTPPQLDRMFPGVPQDRFRIHEWRTGLAKLGEVPGDFVSRVSSGRVEYSVPCEVDRLLVEGKWDRIVSVGQLVPHEVIGIANHNKNIFIGTGGKGGIDKSHFLGAACGMESIMGRAKTPVRDVLDFMSEHFAKHLPIEYVLTVRGKNAEGKLVTRGLYAGDDAECFRVGAALCQQVNLDLLDRPIRRAVVYLDPDEFKSTWLGNKALYRTRMAMADGGELIIIGPGVREFGEDKGIDMLIRRHGYRGTPHTLAAVKSDPELAANLSAAAHLIHGATEGRFRTVWCAGGLSREEIEGVGYAYADPEAMAERFGIESLKDGWNADAEGEFFYISNPALGLWALRKDFPATV